MESEATVVKDDELFDYIFIKLKGFPIFTSQLRLEEYVNSITIGSKIYPSILLPKPQSIHLFRNGTDLTACAILKFDWTMGRSEEEADHRLTEILQACDRLKLAETRLITTVSTPKIEPILICPTKSIHLPNPSKPILNDGDIIRLKPFFPNNPFLGNKNKKQRIRFSSNKDKTSIDNRYDSPRDYSNDEKLNDVEFVKRRHEMAKNKKKDYLSAEKLLRLRAMSWADRLNQ